jgi:hypothetical protein
MSVFKNLLQLIEQDLIVSKSPEAIAQANQAIYLTGNPPKGGDIIRQFAVTPTGKDFYSEDAQYIGASYDSMPIIDPKAVALWQKLGQVCLEQAANLRTVYNITRWDDRDPYTSSDEMFADIANGAYQVTSLHSTHPVWDVETNVAFRIAHDLLGHGSSGGEFSLYGEILAYQGQCMNTPEELWPVLFTEIVAQTCFLNVHHFFSVQKVGLLNLSQQEIDAHVAWIFTNGVKQ